MDQTDTEYISSNTALGEHRTMSTIASASDNRMLQHRMVSTDVEHAGIDANPHGSRGFPPVKLTEFQELSKFPNRWSRIRYIFREPAAEFLGTMILVMFGCGGNAQGVLFNDPKVSTSPAGGYLAVAFGWGVGIALGAWIAGGISGGHINPAVTISLATFRGFPWKKVPIYILAQLLGGIVGAAIVYANYHQAIDLFEGGSGIRTVPGTAGLFGTYAAPYLSNVCAFFEEFIGAFLLLFVLLAVSDKGNGLPPAGLLPLALFFVLFGLGIAFGTQTGFAVNPARDLGPRILTAMVGYGRGVFNYRHQYWIWAGVLAPILGALVATFVYDTFVFTGNESIINRPNTVAREHGAHALNQERYKMPAGADVLAETGIPSHHA